MNADNPQNIDQYIESFPEDIRQILTKIRIAIQTAAPEATESIKYAMPTFVLNGNLVFFAAFKNHIGFYALPSGNQAFQTALAPYKQGKGSIQFPLDQPMPLELITQIVQFRVAENEEKAKKGKKIKK